MSGARRNFDPAPVLARFPGRTDSEVADLLGVNARTVLRWRHGMTTNRADQVAIRLGSHPAILWPDWGDQ